jgi:ubiquinone/menaquinone biosynthesis C-methylase UbiE
MIGLSLNKPINFMAIDYEHSQNIHTLNGPQAALPVLFADNKPTSLLDVGCGTGRT